MLPLIDSLLFFFFLWKLMIKFSWLEAGTLTQSFSFFFLKSCSSEAIFPALTIFIPVERSPSMVCITSDRAGFVTRSRVSFILQARRSTEKDGFAYRVWRRGAVSPICGNMARGHISSEALLRAVRKVPCKSPSRVPLFWGRHPLSDIHIHPVPLPHCTLTGTSHSRTPAYIY